MMLRGIVLVGSAVLAVLAVIVPGIAAAKPVTGNVVCELVGNAVITPGLPLTSTDTATKTYKSTTVFTGTLTNCTGAQTNIKGHADGSSTIDHGTTVAKGTTKFPKGTTLPNCIDLQNPAVPTVLKATTTFFDSNGKQVAKSVANLTVGNAVIAGQVSFPSSGTVSGGNAFKGASATATTNLDGNAGSIAGTCVGGTSTTFSFTDGSSTLEIH